MYEYGKPKVVSLSHFSKHQVVNRLALEHFLQDLIINYFVLQPIEKRLLHNLTERFFNNLQLTVKQAGLQTTKLYEDHGITRHICKKTTFQLSFLHVQLHSWQSYGQISYDSHFNMNLVNCAPDRDIFRFLSYLEVYDPITLLLPKDIQGYSGHFPGY